MGIVKAMRIGLASPFLAERWMRLQVDPWERHHNPTGKFLGAFLLPTGILGLVGWNFYDPNVDLFSTPTFVHIVMIAWVGGVLAPWLWTQRKNIRAEQKFVKACERLQNITGPYHQNNVGLLGEAELVNAARRYLVHLAKNKLLIERNDSPTREEEQERLGQIFKDAWEFLYYKFVLVENGFESYFAEAERELKAVFRDESQTAEPTADPAAAATN